MAFDFDFVQVQSLVGGHIFVADSTSSLELAAEWGVGVIFPDDRIPDDNDFKDSLAEKGLRPFFDVDSGKEGVTFLKGCGAPEPFYFVNAEDMTGRDLSRAFLRVTSEAEVSEGILRSAALVVSDPTTLDAIKKLRGNSDLTPIFAEATSQSHAMTLFSHGVDGSILRFPLDKRNEDEMRELAIAMIEGIEQLPVQSDSSFKIGIVALQGEYRLQAQKFAEALDHPDITLREPVEIQFVRNGDDLRQCKAIVLVGGWSNVQTKLFEETDLDDAILAFHENDGYVLGLCAGMILCRRDSGKFCEHRLAFKFVDVKIDNNKLNRKHDVRVTKYVPQKYRLGKTERRIPEDDQPVFSEAPVVAEREPHVEPLAITAKGEIVAAKQGRTIIMAYHNGPTVHNMFLEFTQGVWEL